MAKMMTAKPSPKDAMKRIGDKIRDLHNLLAVFKQEYDLPKEVVLQLERQIDEISKELKNL
jgi:cob(I)alamin adenosyltransferase